MPKQAHKAASKNQPVTAVEDSKSVPKDDFKDALKEFAVRLADARAFCRAYPTLVRAPEMPEPFFSTFQEHFGKEPEQGLDSRIALLVENGLLISPERQSALYEMSLATLRLEVTRSVREMGPQKDCLAARNRVYASALQATDLSDSEAADLAVCQRLLRDNRGGSVTPFEEFFSYLVMASATEAVIPTRVESDWEEFKSDWIYAVQDFQTFYRNHPELAQRLMDGEEPEAAAA